MSYSFLISDYTTGHYNGPKCTTKKQYDSLASAEHSRNAFIAMYVTQWPFSVVVEHNSFNDMTITSQRDGKALYMIGGILSE